MERRVLRPRSQLVNYPKHLPEFSGLSSSSSSTSTIALNVLDTGNHSAVFSPPSQQSLKRTLRDRHNPLPGIDSQHIEARSQCLPPISEKRNPFKKPNPPKSASRKNLKNIPNTTTFPELPNFEPLIHSVPLHKAHNSLPIELRRLGSSVKPIQIFSLFFTDKLITLMVENTNLYAKKKMKDEESMDQGRNKRWKDITASDLRIWLGISIHMGCVGIPPAHYWRKDGKLLSRDGLPTTPFMSQEKFEQIRRYFHVSFPFESPPSGATWHYKIDPLLDQLRKSSQEYRVPSSNVTVDEAMILCTGRSVHITKVPKKPIGLGYKFFALADRGYIWDFHPSSNVASLDPIDLESTKLNSDYSKTSRMVHTMVRRLTLRHRKKAFNIYMDNYFTTVPLLAELRRVGVGACGTARSNLKGFPKELDIGKKAKMPYHSKTGIVKDGVGVVVWMDSSPVTVMTTIHAISGNNCELLRNRWHPGNKSTNAAGANQEFQGAREKEMMIPIFILDYNMHKVGVDVADQYRTYYDTQLTSRRNWYPIFYWILETALINSLFIYRDQATVSIEHLEYRLEVAWSLIERGVEDINSPEVGLGMSWRKRTAPTEFILPTHKRVSKNTKLPACRLAPGLHLPVHMKVRLHCILCRWNLRNSNSSVEGGKTGVKCNLCNEPLCFTKDRNCFLKFHVS